MKMLLITDTSDVPGPAMSCHTVCQFAGNFLREGISEELETPAKMKHHVDLWNYLRSGAQH
jgi:hypothetical protein